MMASGTVYWAFMKVKKTGRSRSDREKKTVRRAEAQPSATPAALPENEEGLQTFFNALDDMVFVFEPEGRILFSNPAAQNQLGYTPSELAGMTALDLHPPEQRQEAAKLLAGLIAGKITVCPIPLQARDGTRILVETKILHGQWRGKKALFGISCDITRHKLAEEHQRQLAEVNQMLQTVMDTIPVRIFWKNKDLVYLGCNRLFAEDAGRKSPEYILGETDYNLGWREQAELYRKDDREVIRSGNSKLGYEEPQTAPDGKQLWLRTSKIPLRDINNRIVGILGTYEDITERKQAEAELNRLMTAIEQTPESVVITDTAGRILYVNPVFVRVTGYSRAEVIGQNPRLLKSNRQDSAFYRQLWAKISAGEVWRGRFINKKKDGTLFTEDAVIAPVRDEKGAVTNYIAIKRDISHELELEIQYRQTQKIDSIGRLAGGVAHDFNNILAVICGHTDLALAQLSPDAPLRSNLECIQESAERAANLTRQLLAFARRQVIEPRRINLNELIVNLNKMLHRLIGEDIKLVTQTAPDLGQIKADPGQIEQVLLNLVVNARDAMPDGGTLTIHTDNVTLDEDYARRHLVTPGDYVMVSVSDTGAGMTDEVKQHIFEPFFTTKEQGKGTGLGLATCFGIIQQSNGHIHSDSQVDKGTQFKIYLPRVRGLEDSNSSREIPVSLPQGTETILLAEDEPSLRQLMARVLRTQGYTVLEAADGHEALTLAQANGAKIQLLLTDVIMPGLSGKTLAEWLGQVNPAVRVLFISGYINNNAVRDAMSKPGTFFLQKPFNPLNLTEKVREAIEAR
jgi:PAS domain S-box-containing protein